MNKQHYEKIKGKKVLVTGGLGFVGHNLVKSLVTDYGCQVIVVDDCTNSKEETIREVRDKVTFHKMSVMDNNIFGLFKDVHISFTWPASRSRPVVKTPRPI